MAQDLRHDFNIYMYIYTYVCVCVRACVCVCAYVYAQRERERGLVLGLVVGRDIYPIWFKAKHASLSWAADNLSSEGLGFKRH